MDICVGTNSTRCKARAKETTRSKGSKPKTNQISWLAMSKTKIFRHDHKPLQHWFRYRADAYLRFLLSLLHPKQGELILDNGCGNGRFSVVMGQKGASVVALDVNISLLKETSSRAREEMLSDRVELVLADIQSLPFRDDAFDKILCVHNLWYVPRYKIAVKEMVRTLRKNGEILVDHLNLLDLHVFLGWVQYIARKISRRSSTPVFYRIPYEILGPFSPFRMDVFGLVIKHKSQLYAMKGMNPFASRLIIKCSK